LLLNMSNELKRSTAKRALFGEDSPLSMRIQSLNRPELPPFDACCPPPHEPRPCGMLGPVAVPFWSSGDQAAWNRASGRALYLYQ